MKDNKELFYSGFKDKSTIISEKWKEFKNENDLITKGGYVTFRDMPKYPCFNEVEN